MHCRRTLRKRGGLSEPLTSQGQPVLLTLLPLHRPNASDGRDRTSQIHLTPLVCLLVYSTACVAIVCQLVEDVYTVTSHLSVVQHSQRPDIPAKPCPHHCANVISHPKASSASACCLRRRLRVPVQSSPGLKTRSRHGGTGRPALPNNDRSHRVERHLRSSPAQSLHCLRE